MTISIKSKFTNHEFDTAGNKSSPTMRIPNYGNKWSYRPRGCPLSCCDANYWAVTKRLRARQQFERARRNIIVLDTKQIRMRSHRIVCDRSRHKRTRITLQYRLQHHSYPI